MRATYYVDTGNYLMRYHDAACLRPATDEECEASEEQAQHDGGAGVIDATPCQCGTLNVAATGYGEPCTAEPAGADPLVLVETMPACWRASHQAAGNRGAYPANGAVRGWCCQGCAAALVEVDPEWTEIVGA